MTTSERELTTPAGKSTPSADPALPAPLVQWLGVVTLALGVFAIVTAELLPVGLLPAISGEMGVSIGTAGLSITLYGIIAALTAVPLTAAFAHLDRRFLLAGLMAILTAGNIVTAIAPNFTVLLLARILMGFAHGVFWSTTPASAVRLVPAAKAVRATTVVLSGISIASVAGVPLLTVVGQQTDWRTAFYVMAGIGVLVLLGALTLLPRLAPRGSGGLAALPRLVRRGTLGAAVLVTSLVMIGHYLAFTYITPFLEQEAGWSTGSIGAMLLVFGVAGVIGNFLIGPAVGRNLRTALAGSLLLFVVALAGLSLLGEFKAATVVLLVAWGLAYAALPVCLQTWVLKSSPDAPDGASSFYITSFNFSIALGAFAGGRVVDGIGLGTITWVAAALAAVALLVVLAARRVGEPAPDAVTAD
ncbi:MFS transporter [Actinokineospora inagensis]|uniref:MFS transporter n=1 Tax=Actinokineospora inagensis TaxID=103730 RepID=UPI000408F084|nr:MFS transporter [Actinokineospora inagensis]